MDRWYTINTWKCDNRKAKRLDTFSPVDAEKERRKKRPSLSYVFFFPTSKLFCHCLDELDVRVTTLGSGKVRMILIFFVCKSPHKEHFEMNLICTGQRWGSLHLRHCQCYYVRLSARWFFVKQRALQPARLATTWSIDRDL